MFTESEIAVFKNQYDALVLMAKNFSSAKQIIGYFDNTFKTCSNIQYIKFDALEKKDYPNNIPENSIFVCFEIDFDAKKVELSSTGHVYLSKKDADSDKYKYYAMRGMHNIAQEDYMVKKFRKQGFKTIDDLFDKMECYYKNVMKAITDYTGGYPYKSGI